MKKIKNLFALLCAAALALAVLTGCGEEPASEVDTKQYAAAASDSVGVPDWMDTTARFETEYVDGSVMYLVFNGIQNRETEYFYAPDGQLTFTMTTTGESSSIKYTKVAVWTKVPNGTRYVEGSTIYFAVSGQPLTYTVTGLDPALEYRLTISYDSAKYYASGQLRVDGATDVNPNAAASSGAAA